MVTGGPPFLIEGLPAGQEIELALLVPASGDQPGADRFLFEVRAGAQTRVQVQLRELVPPTGG